MVCNICNGEKTLIVGWSGKNNLGPRWEHDACPACQPPPHSFHARQKAEIIASLRATEGGRDNG